MIRKTPLLHDSVWIALIVVSVSASRAVGHWFASWSGHTKDHHEKGTNCLPGTQAL